VLIIPYLVSFCDGFLLDGDVPWQGNENGNGYNSTSWFATFTDYIGWNDTTRVIKGWFETINFNTTANDVYWNTSLVDDVATYNLYLGGADGTESEASIYEFEGDMNITGNLTVGAGINVNDFLKDFDGNSFAKYNFTDNNFNCSGNITTTGNINATDGGTFDGIEIGRSIQSRINIVEDAPSSTYWGIRMQVDANKPSSGTSALLPLNFAVNVGNATSGGIYVDVGTLNGDVFNWEFSNVTRLYVMKMNPFNIGKIETYKGLWLNLINAGEIVSGKQIDINGFTTSTGDAYGIDIGNIASGSGDAYAIKTGTGLVDLGDDAIINGDLNVTGNITDVNYIKLDDIGGACDLTINGSICTNATGTYIVG